MNLEKYIRDIKDFPIKGIVFKDITPIFQNPEAFKYTIDKISENLRDVDVLVGLDARGFLFVSTLSYILGKPFTIIRKKGKLPYKTIGIDYDLEYGSNSFEIHIDSIKKGQKIGIVDDLLATGGTAFAACELVEKLGGIVDSLNFVINLEFLEGNKKLSNYQINSLIKY